MSTFDLPVGKVTSSVLDQLVELKKLECLQLEYKEALPSRESREKFLTSIASFANKAGGDLIYGIRGQRDQEGTPTGEAEKIVGLPNTNLDQEKLRLHQWIRDLIEPPPTVFMEVINREPEPPCLLIRVRPSWSEVHMVTSIGNPFYGRNSAGKYPLARTEIRDAFLMRQTAREIVRHYRQERIEKISAANVPTYVGTGPFVIFHALPINPDSGFWDRFRCLEDETNVIQNGVPMSSFPLQLINGYIQDWNYNADGFLFRTVQERNSYLQVFRDGGIEAVDTSLERVDTIYFVNIERGVIKALKGYQAFCQRLDIGTPLFLSVALAGVNGCLVNFIYRNPAVKAVVIDRDVLIAPEVVVEDLLTPADKILKPIFDYFWNAGGLPESLHYKDGHWIGDKS